VIKGARAASGETRPAMIQKAYKVIDKAVQNGLIHKNAGARYKSHMAKKQTAKEAAAPQA
jgi:ribosomal protein S20